MSASNEVPITKDKKYRQAHPDRVKESSRLHYERNKASYREKRRQRYIQNRSEILEKLKNDRVSCPLCIGITFNRSYLPKHLSNRHALDQSTILALSDQK